MVDGEHPMDGIIGHQRKRPAGPYALGKGKLADPTPRRVRDDVGNHQGFFVNGTGPAECVRGAEGIASITVLYSAGRSGPAPYRKRPAVWSISRMEQRLPTLKASNKRQMRPRMPSRVSPRTSASRTTSSPSPKASHRFTPARGSVGPPVQSADRRGADQDWR